MTRTELYNLGIRMMDVIGSEVMVEAMLNHVDKLEGTLRLVDKDFRLDMFTPRYNVNWFGEPVTLVEVLEAIAKGIKEDMDSCDYDEYARLGRSVEELKEVYKMMGDTEYYYDEIDEIASNWGYCIMEGVQ